MSKSSNNLYETVPLPFFDTKNGKLTAIYHGGSKNEPKLPFDIKKVLIIRDMEGGDVRGGHTHHETVQLLACLQGSCAVTLDDGTDKETVVLEAAGHGIILHPYVWHTMHDFQGNTILLVAASHDYDEADYIRDYDTFLTWAKKKKTNSKK